MSTWTSYNGLVNTMGYDSDLRLTGISVPGVQSLAFTWDAADRITAITNGINGSYTQSLGYDAVDRLTSMTSGARNESYQYDAVGNRIHQVVNGVATNFAYASGSNRLTSASGGISATYGYNAYGSTTTVNGVTTYTYGPFARLANAGGATFEISAEDQRLRKAFGGNVTYFVPGAGGALLAEHVNGTWKDYVWLNGRPVAMITNGTVYSVHADQTGRAMALTAPNQSVAWATRNDPFDRSTVTGSAAFFALGFPGQYWDAEDNLWHNGFRDYDPKTGRYIQSDPIGLGGGVNTYAYVSGNPISLADPLGLRAKCKCTGDGGANININLKFKGSGATPEVIAAMRSSIESRWSTAGFNVTTSIGGWRASVINVPAGNGRSFVQGNGGTWYGGADPWVAAHEAGHLMKLDDRYTETTPGVTTPQPGWEGTIMGQYMGGVTPADRREVLNALGCK